MWEYHFSKDTWARECHKTFQTKQHNICQTDKTILQLSNESGRLPDEEGAQGCV